MERKSEDLDAMAKVHFLGVIGSLCECVFILLNFSMAVLFNWEAEEVKDAGGGKEFVS